jgi:hypothetical protein
MRAQLWLRAFCIDLMTKPVTELSENSQVLRTIWSRPRTLRVISVAKALEAKRGGPRHPPNQGFPVRGNNHPMTTQ